MDKEMQTSDGVSFEKAMAELEDLVKQLEEGDMPLEESMDLFERGQRLAQHCNTLLDAAEIRVQQIDLSPGDWSQSGPSQLQSDG